MSELKFHWRMLQGGERAFASRAFQASLAETGLPDVDAKIDFCRAAEDAGIDSLLTDFGWGKPDPIVLCTALGLATTRIKLIIAYRSGLMGPTSFVQQINTLSALIDGRLSLNIVAGDSPEEQRYYGDFLGHDARYERTEEFLAIARGLWRREGPVTFEGAHYRVEAAQLNTPYVSPDRDFPEIFIAGNSPQAKALAISQGTCWMQIAETPERIRERGAEVLRAGKELGVRLSVIGAKTRGEALHAAYALVQGTKTFDDRSAEAEFARRSDSHNVAETYERASRSEWLRPWLWSGAARSHGTPAISMVGSPRDIADGVEELRQAGVTQFILSGWPKLESMLFFAREVMPLVRAREREGRELAAS